MAYIKIGRPGRGLRGLGGGELRSATIAQVAALETRGGAASLVDVNAARTNLARSKATEPDAWSLGQVGATSYEGLIARINAVEIAVRDRMRAEAAASPTTTSTTTFAPTYMARDYVGEAMASQDVARQRAAQCAEIQRRISRGEKLTLPAGCPEPRSAFTGSIAQSTVTTPITGTIRGTSRSVTGATKPAATVGTGKKTEEGGSFWESLTEVLGIGAGVAKGVVESEAQRRAERDRIRAERRAAASSMTPASMAPTDMGGVVKLAAGVAVVGVAIWGVSKLLGGGRTA